MIKANDLKPGDLVRVCEDNWQIKKGTICEILSIDLFHKYCSELNWVTVSNPNSYIDKVRLRCIDIEGIPLTPEILEKNGFEIREGTVAYAKNRLALKPLDEGKAYQVGLGSLRLLFVKVRVIKYVHELQHILWALGLDANLKI